jgi:hypothetical protein
MDESDGEIFLKEEMGEAQSKSMLVQYAQARNWTDVHS